MYNRFLLSFLFLFFAVFSFEAMADEKYRIGAILPLSGPNASLGNYLKNGIDLAYSELSKDQQEKLEIIYEDDQLQTAKSVSAFQKLKSQKGIQAVLVLGSGIGNAIAPLAERSEVVCVAIGASDGDLAKGTQYAFTHWVTPEVEADVMIDEMVRRNYKKIAVIGVEQEGSIAIIDAVKKAAEKKGLSKKFVAEKRFLTEERDFKTYIAKLKQKQVDAVVTVLFPGALSSFAKQARQYQLEADLAGIELFENESEVKASERALVGQWYVNADLATGSFQAAYKKRYGQAPGWAAANAYDSVMLIAQAIQQPDATPATIATLFKTLKNYQGAAGVYSASGDNRFHLPATIKIVEKDGFSKLQG